MTEDDEFWTTDELGKHITRYDALDRQIDDLIENHYDPLSSLAEAVRADKRKTFSKSVLLDLIEEYR